jgi:lysyl-tRNA synthetase class 2
MGDTSVENGEKLSKNELKRRMKAEKKTAEKVEKVHAKLETLAVTDAETKKILEEEISPNEYFKLRSSAVEALKTDPATHPYPHKFHVSISLTDLIEKYNSLEPRTTLTEVETRVAGRIHAIRESGAKLIFYDLRGEGTKIQVSVLGT